MSWNVGGLSEVLFEELKKWLNLEEQREVCVLILQENALGFQFGLVGKRMVFLSFLHRETWQWRHPHRSQKYRSRCSEYQVARTGTRTHSSCLLFSRRATDGHYRSVSACIPDEGGHDR